MDREVRTNRATAATLAVAIALSGTGPLLAEGAQPTESQGLERILGRLQPAERSVLLRVSGAGELTVPRPALSRLQAGAMQQQADPPRRGGDATMIVFYSLFLGGIAMAVDGLTDDPNSKRKVLGGLALVGSAFAVSCATGPC
ncbi:MAG: hypothetical protein OXH75_23765 [Acidobacteria bacterium]|nr:hypothetical protein [Acidobacteriota bacterium]